MLYKALIAPATVELQPYLRKEPIMIKRFASTALVVLAFALAIMAIMLLVVWGIDHSSMVNSLLQEFLPDVVVPKLF